MAEPHQRVAGTGDIALKGVVRPAAHAESDGGREPVAGDDRRIADIHHHRGAGAVGGLGHAWAMATLPEQRRMAVAEYAGDGNAAVAAEIAVRAENGLGHERGGDAEQVEQLRAPCQRAQLHQLRAAGVGGVGEVFAAGEAVNEVTVNGAQAQFTLFSARFQILPLRKEGTHLACGEVGREVEPGDLMDALGMRRQFPAGRLAAHILPDDGRADRFSAGGVPQNSGLALVGDGDGGDVLRACLVDEVVDERLYVVPDLRGIVFNAAGGGVVLLMLQRAALDDETAFIDEKSLARGGGLIDGDDVPHSAFTAAAMPSAVSP